MGGYGALKTALAYPEQFGVVAAMQPMLEPGLHDFEIGARNSHSSFGRRAAAIDRPESRRRAL